MTKTQAEAFRDVLNSAKVLPRLRCHVQEIAKNSNGWSVVIPGKVRLTQLEEAQRYVNAIGAQIKADA